MGFKSEEETNGKEEKDSDEGRMTVSHKLKDNEQLVNHIRAISSKSNFSVDYNTRNRIQELENIVHYAPFLKLKVHFLTYFPFFIIKNTKLCLFNSRFAFNNAVLGD